MGCEVGYLSTSPLCALCDRDVAQMAMTRGYCRSCEWPASLYTLFTLCMIFGWFPIMAYLCELMESLEITFAFLQFLGLYSDCILSSLHS